MIHFRLTNVFHRIDSALHWPNVSPVECHDTNQTMSKNNKTRESWNHVTVHFNLPIPGNPGVYSIARKYSLPEKYPWEQSMLELVPKVKITLVSDWSNQYQVYSGSNRTTAILNFDFPNKFQQTSFPGGSLGASNERQNIPLGSRGCNPPCMVEFFLSRPWTRKEQRKTTAKPSSTPRSSTSHYTYFNQPCMVEFFLSHPQTGKEIKEDLSKQCTCIVKADLDGTTFAYVCRTQLAYDMTYVPFTQLQLLALDTTKSCQYNLFGLDFAARASFSIIFVAASIQHILLLAPQGYNEDFRCLPLTILVSLSWKPELSVTLSAILKSNTFPALLPFGTIVSRYAILRYTFTIFGYDCRRVLKHDSKSLQLFSCCMQQCKS